MSALRVARRHLSRWGAENIILALVAAFAGVALLLSYAPTPSAEARPVQDIAAMPPAKTAALIDATTGEQAGGVLATGAKAQKVNAALPFSKGPVQAATPFAAPTGGTAYERALTCLTQAVYYEAGFEPLEGRRAVAQVVLNRTRHPAFPKSVCGVVYQRNATPVCQFSFVCDGSLNRAPAPTAWAEARRIAAAALAGFVEPSVGSATHYHADYVAPRWAPLLAKITRIGAHIFYRWPGALGQAGAFTGRYIGEPMDPAALRPVIRPAAFAQGNPNGAVAVHPPVARASNDVGGLLDTSKGWTLSIPVPSETGKRTQVIVQHQESKPVVQPAAIAVTAAASGGAVLAAN